MHATFIPAIRKASVVRGEGRNQTKCPVVGYLLVYNGYPEAYEFMPVAVNSDGEIQDMLNEGIEVLE